MELLKDLDGKQLRFIQNNDDAQLVLTGQFLDMLADAGMKRGKTGMWFQSHADRKLAIKVASVDSGVIRIVKPVASLGEILFQGAQQTGLAAAGVPGNDGGGPACDGCLERL